MPTVGGGSPVPLLLGRLPAGRRRGHRRGGGGMRRRRRGPGRLRWEVDRGGEGQNRRGMGRCRRRRVWRGLLTKKRLRVSLLEAFELVKTSISRIMQLAGISSTVYPSIFAFVIAADEQETFFLVSYYVFERFFCNVE